MPPTPQSPGPKPTKRMPLLDDEPILSHETDRLGVLQYADVIAGAALGTVGPFTIGVFGGWGEGKTSILRAAESRLNEKATKENATTTVKEGARHHPHVIPVWFNAWQFEREPHPIVPLVASIQKAVVARITDDRSILEKTGEAGRTFLTRLVRGGSKLLSSTKVNVGVEVDFGKVVEAAGELLDDKEKQEPTALTKAIDDSLHMAVFEEMSRLGAEARDNAAAPGWGFPRVVVFVDDLDRCTPDKAFELIEAIKVVFAQAGFIFVLALNRDVVDVYVHAMWKKRLESNDARLISRYLDKIIQLPLYVRSHKQEFRGFVASRLERLKGMGVDSETMAVLESVQDHLGETTAHSPRALVRRINTLLIDQKLRPTSSRGLKVNGKKLSDAQYVGLCLVQRTLLDYLPLEEIKAIEFDATFRKKLAAQDQGNTESTSHALQDWIDAENRIAANEDVREPVDEEREKELSRWSSFLFRIRANPPVAYVLSQPFGKLWLRNTPCRTLVADFVSTVQSLDGESEEVIVVGDVASGSTGVARCKQSFPARELKAQRALIERAARSSLGLPGEREMHEPTRGRVKRLDFSNAAISDAGLAILSDPAEGYINVRELCLFKTNVSDVGIEAITQPDSALKNLEDLNLTGTRVTNRAALALSSHSSPIRGLTKLNFTNTKITDEAIIELASPNAPFGAVIELRLADILVGDKAIDSLTTPSSPFKSLQSLDLAGTEVSDKSIEFLARHDSVVQRLHSLDMSRTNLTTAALHVMSREMNSLCSLESITLHRTSITYQDSKVLQSPSSPMKRLANIYI